MYTLFRFIQNKNNDFYQLIFSLPENKFQGNKKFYGYIC